MLEIEAVRAELAAAFPGGTFELRRGEAGQPCILVGGADIAAVCRLLRDHPEHPLPYLACLSGVDAGEQLAVVYHLAALRTPDLVALRVETPRAAPLVPTVSGVFATANWHEREAFDLLGIVFAGHPDLRRILMPDDWPGHPLRKDYENPPTYHGLTTTRPDVLEMLARRTAVAPGAGEEATAP